MDAEMQKRMYKDDMMKKGKMMPEMDKSKGRAKAVKKPAKPPKRRGKK